MKLFFIQATNILNKRSGNEINYSEECERQGTIYKLFYMFMYFK